MNSGEIDKVILAIKNDNKEYLWKCADMEGKVSDDTFNDNKEEVYSKIYKKIQQGDLEYFLNKCSGFDTMKDAIEILLCSGDTESMKSVVKKCEPDIVTEYKECEKKLLKKINDLNFLDEYIETVPYGIWNPKELTKLIASMNNEKYTDKWIRRINENKAPNTLHNESNIVSLIVESKDFHYADKWIAQREEMGWGVNLVVELIKSIGDKDFTTKYIERRKELKFNSDDLVEMINSINEEEYTDYWIGEREKLGFTFADIICLSPLMNKEEYINGLIKKREKLGLNSDEIVSLISSAKRSQFIDSWIEKRNELGLEYEQTITLVKSLKQKKYIDKWIKRAKELNMESKDVCELIKAVDEAYYTNECIKNSKELGLENKEIVELLLEKTSKKIVDKWIKKRESIDLSTLDTSFLIAMTKDKDYIKDCLKNRRKELKLGAQEIVTLITCTPEEIDVEKHVKYCLKHKKELELQSKDILKLLLRLGKEKYYKYAIKNKEKLGFNDSELEVLKIVSDDEYSKKILERDNNNYSSQISLPSNMTVGIEIECFGEYAKGLYNISSFSELYSTTTWTCSGDGSIKSEQYDEFGVELTSPILTGSNKKNTNMVRNLCYLLKDKFGQYTNDTCGGHVHIGANYLTSIQSWRNLLELYGNTEKILYLIGNEEGNIPRKGTIKYATPVSKDLKKALDSGSIDLENENDLEELKNELVDFQTRKGRYKGINFENLRWDGHGTIEFRLSNGTVNADTWIQNINLFGGLVKTAEELSMIQKKSPEQRSEEELQTLKNFERVRSGKLNEKEKLEALLEIVIPEEDRDVYQRRHKTNLELLHKNPELEKELDKNISQESINLFIEEIKNGIFEGNDCVKGDDFFTAEVILEKEFKKNEKEK